MRAGRTRWSEPGGTSPKYAAHPSTESTAGRIALDGSGCRPADTTPNSSDRAGADEIHAAGLDRDRQNPAAEVAITVVHGQDSAVLRRWLEEVRRSSHSLRGQTWCCFRIPTGADRPRLVAQHPTPIGQGVSSASAVDEEGQTGRNRGEPRVTRRMPLRQDGHVFDGVPNGEGNDSVHDRLGRRGCSPAASYVPRAG